jgi:syntaxin 1B/2/3
MCVDLESSVDRKLDKESTDYRLCHAQSSSLSRKLRNCVYDYQAIQRSYQEKQKSRFSRQYRIINPSASDEEIQEMLSAEYRGPIFADSILAATKLDEANRVLHEVTARHKEIMNLTKTIGKLEKLFEELSVMVEMQDDLVNQVAYQTDNAKTYLGTSNEVLQNAVKSAASARKRKWCILILCLVLCGIIAAVVAIVLVPYMKRQ